MYEDDADMLTLDEQLMFLLLFADDTVLFSYSIEGLQKLLDNMKTYCDKWGITVNTDKTVAMVFKKNNRSETFDIFYDNFKLQIVNKFTYLGVTLSSNGVFYQAQKSLSKQALKALFALYSLFDTVSLNIPEKIKLFDCMISPILQYGSEMWGFHKAPDIERVHTKFLKNVLRVRQQTTNAAIYGELGRVQLSMLHKTRILKFWCKIVNQPDSLLHKVYNLRDNDGNFTNTWSKNVYNLLNDLGFSYLYECRTVTNIQIQSVIRRVYDQYFQRWFADLQSLPKLRTYNTIKTMLWYRDISHSGHQ